MAAVFSGSEAFPSFLIAVDRFDEEQVVALKKQIEVQSARLARAQSDHKRISETLVTLEEEFRKQV